MLVINNIIKKHADKHILDDVSLRIQQGEIAVLLGSSGVGKSTLLSILSGLDTVDAGEISFDGKPFDMHELHKTHSVGMVFQHFNLFPHLTVSQNIELALEKVANLPALEAQRYALSLLTQYGIADKKDKYPHQLSGGQKQRLAIARAIALKPRVICMDEPTSALDPLLTSHVAQLITELAAQGYAIILATHDMSLVKRLKCTIYLMRAGHIIETVQHDEFARNPEQYPLLHNFMSGDDNSIE